jgi:transposase
MTKQQIWKKRVAQWRASGTSMRKFCEGRGYSPGGLYYWVRKIDAAEASAPPLSFSRVVVASRSPAADAPDDRVSTTPRRMGSRPAVMVEVGTARVTVEQDVDRTTLAMVLDLLGAARAREAR